MIKAMFFDLDGTLLNDEKKIQQSSKIVLNKCKKQGINICIATARPPLLKKMLSFSEEEEQLFDGGVYCNGGCLKINNVREYMYIPKEVVSKTIDTVKKYNGLNIALQMENEIHAFRYPLEDYAYDKWGIEKEESLTLEQAYVDKSVKILIHYENIIDSVTRLPKELIEELYRYCEGKAVMYVTDEEKVIQIINKDTNKKQSIEKIRRKLGIEKDEVAVFGNDVNDIEMLSAYKNSVAMGNSEEKVKEIANIITKGNNDDGIAYAIENILNVNLF